MGPHILILLRLISYYGPMKLLFSLGPPASKLLWSPWGPYWPSQYFMLSPGGVHLDLLKASVVYFGSVLTPWNFLCLLGVHVDPFNILGIHLDFLKASVVSLGSMLTPWKFLWSPWGPCSPLQYFLWSLGGPCDLLGVHVDPCWDTLP